MATFMQLRALGRVLLAGAALGLFASRFANAAPAGCDGGEFVELSNPVVTVVDGPGSAEDEADRWPEYAPDGSYAYFIGEDTVDLGDHHSDVHFKLGRTR